MHAVDSEVVFCFAGQGFVPLEAARDLYRNHDRFRESMEEVEAAILKFHESEGRVQTDEPLSEYLMEAEPRPASTPNSTSGVKECNANRTQAPSATMCIFAFQYALARTIQARGIFPTSIVGYSLGEHIASMVTKSLPLDVGIKLLLRRDRLFQDRNLITSVGGMVTVQAVPEKTICVLAENGSAGLADVGGYPHKNSTILSGDEKALDKAQDMLSNAGVDTQRRAIQLGMHSEHVNGVVQELHKNPSILPDAETSNAKVVAGINHWSCLGIRLSEGTPLNARYWATQLRTPIHFKQCIEGIHQTNMKESPEKKVVFLDLGMGPRLTRLIQNTLQDTPEWQSGHVKTISLIQPMALDAAEKAKDGWAVAALDASVARLDVK